MTTCGGANVVASRRGGLTFREATEADLPAVLALYVAAGISVGESFSISQAAAQLEVFKHYPYLRVFIAASGDEIVGTYQLLIMENLAKRGARSGVVEDVAVHPDFQRQGVGRAMMEHAVQQCRGMNCYKLTLSSNSRREAAHGFYEAIGFERHGYSFQIEV